MSKQPAFSRRLFCSCCAGAVGASVFPGSAIGQEFIDTSGTPLCAGSEMIEQAGLWTFEASPEAIELVDTICSAVGITPNFVVRAAAVGENIANAAAFIQNRFTSNPVRMILYNEGWVQNYLRQTGDTYWAGLALMAHECAHHINGHTIDNLGSQPPRELEADRFAGFIVRRLGGTLAQAESLFRGFPQEETRTHPARRDRLVAVAVGWRQGAGFQGSPEPPADSPQEVPAPTGDERPVATGDAVCEGRPPGQAIRNVRSFQGDQGEWYDVSHVCEENGQLYEWTIHRQSGVIVEAVLVNF